MFDRLLASTPSSSPGRAGGTLVSVVTHGALIVGLLGSREPSNSVSHHSDTTAIYVPFVPRRTPAPSPSTVRVSRPAIGPITVPPDIAVPAVHAPLPTFVPVSIPRGTIGSGGTDPFADAAIPVSSGMSIYDAAVVDERPELLSRPIPRYPAILREAGIEGRVDLEFVVDTAGAVEAGSIRVLESSHPAFVRPAIDALQRARFRPGRSLGRTVRVLVRQTFSFRMIR